MHDYVCSLSLGLFVYFYGYFFSVLIFIFSVLAKKLAGKSISKMTCVVLSGMWNFNSVNQSGDGWRKDETSSGFLGWGWWFLPHHTVVWRGT